MTKMMHMLTLVIPGVQLTAVLLVIVMLNSITANQAFAWQHSVQSDDPAAVRIESILMRQAKYWNEKNIEGFMATYWNSDQLTFSGGGKTIRGWQATLDRYREKYPPEKMGLLSFDHLEVTMLGPSSTLVLGDWHLKLDAVGTDGNFSLVLRKIDGEWKIIHDHSSTLPNE